MDEGEAVGVPCVSSVVGFFVVVAITPSDSFFVPGTWKDPDGKNDQC